MNESFEQKGAVSEQKIEVSDITNPDADQRGEYPMHRDAALDLLNLASEKGVITDDQREVVIHDLHNARNAFEMLQASRVLTRRLYQEAVDYSDILLRHGVINQANYEELKSNLSRGKDFTTRDLENADHIDTLGAQAAAGIEDPSIAGEEILKGLDRMHLSKKIHPEKDSDS